MLRTTFLVSTARLISTFVTLLLGVYSARYFGASAAKDSYVVAQTIPALLTALLTGGVYSSLLISLLEIGGTGGIRAQAQFCRRVAWHMTLLLSPFLLAAMLFPRLLIEPIAPGFGEDRLALSSQLLPLTAITALAALYLIIVRCLYQIHGQFVLPNFLYLIIPITSVVTLVALVGRFGILALALGPLAGHVIAVTLLVLLVRTRLRDPAGFVPDPESATDRRARQRAFWIALLPMTFAAHFGQINLLVDNAFGSFLPAGNITLLGFAFVIISNTELLTTLSLAEVAFPQLAAAALQGPADLTMTFRTFRRYIVLLTAPLTAGALTFGTPLVRLLFQRGEFHPDATAHVARLLACYAPEIFFMGYLVLFARVLFARRRFVLVTWTSAAAILANALLDFLLMRPFGVYGIALATTLVSFLHMLMLVPLVRREVPTLRLLEDAPFTGKVLSSAAVMGLLVLGWSLLFEHAFDTTREMARLTEVGVGLTLGGVAYVGLLHALRVEEARDLVKRFFGALPLLTSP